MRKKLIKLLRQLEQEDNYKNEYIEGDGYYECSYSIMEYLDFPDYRFIIKKYNDDYSLKKKGVATIASSNSITAELKRMEADKFIMIEVQEGVRCGDIADGQGPDFGDNFKFTSESIVLTSKGKSKWGYFKAEIYTAKTLSIIAIIISIFALSI